MRETTAEGLPPLPEPTFFTHDFDLRGNAHRVTGYTADQMREYALAALTLPPAAGQEPAMWQCRNWYRGEGGEPVGWGKWDEVKATSYATVEERVAEIRSYIEQGYKYQLRPLYAALPLPPAAGQEPGFRLTQELREFVHDVAVRRNVRLYAEDLSDRARAIVDADAALPQGNAPAGGKTE